MKPEIVFEDGQLLILAKPPGWIVNEAKTTKGAEIIQTWLRDLDYKIAKSRKFRGGIVHRLDKETSGILVIAKTPRAFKNLQAQFKERKVEKRYKALVHGKVELQKGEINVPVGRLPWNRERFGVLPGGRKAETEYKVIANYKNEKGEFYSLLTILPKTGRTHQIRVHMKYIRHPVVADEFYAGRKRAKIDRTWCPRLFLHAASIEFTHPFESKKVSFKSKLPKDLKEALSKLEKVH